MDSPGSDILCNAFPITANSGVAIRCYGLYPIVVPGNFSLLKSAKIGADARQSRKVAIKSNEINPNSNFEFLKRFVKLERPIAPNIKRKEMVGVRKRAVPI